MLTLTTVAVAIVFLLGLFLAYIAGLVSGERKGRLDALESLYTDDGGD